jgi:hypothetical protein
MLKTLARLLLILALTLMSGAALPVLHRYCWITRATTSKHGRQ